MTKVSILKTAKYNPIQDNLSKYESLDLITKGEYSPPITADFHEIVLAVDKEAVSDADFILHSPSLRAAQTAQIIKETLGPKAVLLETPYLSEVKFSLKDLVLQKEYEEQGSNLVRKRFIESFMANDKKIESRELLLSRINGLFDLLKSHEYQEKRIVCISHSFFMKILQIFLKEPTLFENPTLLSKYFDWQKRTFEFCQGFYINV